MTMTSREMKSKVMSLGNRLATRMDRHDAFVRAWQILKAGGLELAVRGVSFGNRQEALKRLAAYAPDQVRAFVVPEPENAADRKAARVMVGVQNGRGLYCLGYLPSEYAPAVGGFKVAGLRVLEGDIRGARLALAV
jgi:guanyl-specific ribonuclease Sa